MIDEDIEQRPGMGLLQIRIGIGGVSGMGCTRRGCANVRIASSITGVGELLKAIRDTDTRSYLGSSIRTRGPKVYVKLGTGDT